MEILSQQWIKVRLNKGWIKVVLQPVESDKSLVIPTTFRSDYVTFSSSILQMQRHSRQHKFFIDQRETYWARTRFFQIPVTESKNFRFLFTPTWSIRVLYIYIFLVFSSSNLADSRTQGFARKNLPFLPNDSIALKFNIFEFLEHFLVCLWSRYIIQTAQNINEKFVK